MRLALGEGHSSTSFVGGVTGASGVDASTSSGGSVLTPPSCSSGSI